MLGLAEVGFGVEGFWGCGAYDLGCRALVQASWPVFGALGWLWPYELQSRLLVSPLITSIVVPYIIPYMSLFKEFSVGSYELQSIFLHNFTNMGSFLRTRLVTILNYKRDPSVHTNTDSMVNKHKAKIKLP